MRRTIVIPTIVTAIAAVAPMLFLPSCRAGESKGRSAQLRQPIFTTAPGSPFPTGKRPSSIAVGDLNNDRKLDFVTANKDSKDVTISLGNGRGDFKPASGSPVKTRATPQFIAMGDLNNDGNLDLAIAPHDGGYDVTILLGDGKGVFRTAANSPLVPLKATSPHNHGSPLVM